MSEVGEFINAGVAAMGAICLTNPVDVVKTRMVTHQRMAAQPYQGVADALAKIAKAEGLAGLQRGLAPACAWQFSNVSMRFGVYGVAKGRIKPPDDASPLQKYLASLGMAATSGAVAALVSNPFFIAKTRAQATSSDPRLAVGQQHANTSVAGTLAAIVRADGPAGLFRGLSAFAPRVIVASAVQLSTYDSVKADLQRRLALPDGIALHAASSLLTGVAVVIAMQPFDFAATRLVNSLSKAERAGATSAAAYSGPWDVIRQTVRSEGPLGVYKGVTANYLRFGPYCVLVFVFLEKLRALERGVKARLRT